ncbi:MAG TPA: [FeFe] hydrogenase H-cluster maturation GTPase HydF [Bacteroidales bacterium]|nr:[FeFe] hydrogenase H-cluster maturation GTPase HydF [Bacteroidales bacterium]HOK97541.1 [FeFe] hydrogenase H-cluster maturation GTPase HydF [Bacteroidales bacterium]HPO64361.1 [FeFe] hydrogenase H-cluster maturation GTPase HydF [Bacteroidales bacterium]
MAREVTPHIGIFGRRNNGKSSLINAIAGHDVAIVSDIAGTTTDPVKKSVEIFGIGPAIFVDTAGIDDEGDLGEKRIKKTLQAIQHIDFAILVITANTFDSFEKRLVDEFRKYDVPYLIAHNKNDLTPLSENTKQELQQQYGSLAVVPTSTFDNQSIKQLIEAIQRHMPETAWKKKSIIGDLIQAGDLVLLIVPIDNEAPEGRLILPQVQLIRDVLDNHAIAIVLKETEVESFFNNHHIKPRLAITDSSIFKKADKLVPKEIPLTGFSVVLARHKGPFEAFMDGTYQLSKLKDGDRVLILESCTHQVTCEDIGRFKLPRWISEFTGKKLTFDVVSGLGSIPEKVSDYALVIQCGACMITSRQVHSRMKKFIEAGIPITNYGLAIAYMHGVFERAIAPFRRQ